MSGAHLNTWKNDQSCRFFGHKHYPIQVIALFFFCQMMISFIGRFIDTICYLLMQ